MDTSEKMEGATLKLGSIAIEEKMEIEDNLTEESLKTPWWAKLKKKHEDKMAADQDQEGRTTTEIKCANIKASATTRVTTAAS